MSEIKMGKIIIDFPDSHKDVAKGLADRIAEELSDRSGHDFKCADCGEKYSDDMASVNDVALCVHCDTIELERNACEDDEYADKGMSRGDFIDKEYT